MRVNLEPMGRLQALSDFISAHEARHGVITPGEIRSVARRTRSRAIVVRGRAREGRRRM